MVKHGIQNLLPQIQSGKNFLECVIIIPQNFFKHKNLFKTLSKFNLLCWLSSNNSHHLACNFGDGNTKSPANASKIVAVVRELLLAAVLNSSDEHPSVYTESQFLPHQKTT